MDNTIKFIKDGIENLAAYNRVMVEAGRDAHNPFSHTFGVARDGDSEFSEKSVRDVDTMLNLASVSEISVRPGEDGAVILECRAPAPVGTAVDTVLRPGKKVIILPSHGGIGGFGNVQKSIHPDTYYWTMYFSPEWINGELRFVFASTYPGKAGLVPNKRGLEVNQILDYDEAIRRNLRIKPLPEGGVIPG